MSEHVPSNQRTTATPSLADRFHPLRSDTEPVDQETGPHIKGKPGEKPVEIPEKIGRFAIRGILGAGSYGIVYRGFDAELGRDVAVKVPRIAEMSDADIERFLRDARAAAVIHHQNICPVYDVGKEGRQPFIVLHLVAGDTLAKIIEQRQFLPPRAAAAILRKLAQGVAKAHTHGVVHRDLKPANVLFDRTGNDVLITDFGLAVFAEETLATADGRRGTPAYMAPEQARGAVDEIDPKTDIYALGVILYHLMTGTTPFRGSIESVMYQVVHEQPRAPSGIRPGIDPKIEAICLRAMAKKPEDRFASAKDLSNVLGDYLRNPETPAKADTSEADADATASGQEFLAPLLQFDDAACRTESKRDEPRRKRGRSPNFIFGGSVLAVVVVSMAILGFVLTSKPFSTAINGEDEARTFSPVAETMMGIEGVPPATSKVGETREVEIAPGVAMAFCWIPAGECQLGSKPAERNAMLKFLQESKEPDWMRRESEERRPKFRTDGFWMGKFEVTQAEWAAVMKGTAIATPSAFRVGGKRNGELNGISDTARFPVETVTWDDCQMFLERANAHGAIDKAFGKAGSFALPQKDQWEYACRAGRGNAQAFFWGNVLNGMEANCDGDYPCGTNEKGDNLKRPCPADYTNGGKYPTHPWGLCHMHGNVWEWCSCDYDKSNTRVLRGGSWLNNAYFCRAALINWDLASDFHSGCFGCRLVILLEK